MMISLSLAAVILVPVLIILGTFVFIAKQYKRCPSNQVLVIFGKVGDNKSAKCIHGGGAFIIPLIQGYEFLSLDPMTLNVDLQNALSKTNIRTNVPSNFTIGISTKPELLTNAAERLLGLNLQTIVGQAREIIFGQMRLVVATLTIEEINQDREKFLKLVATNVDTELNKLGLEVINVNITDITDQSGYIAALGKKAASEAIQQAMIDVAQQERKGSIGVETATKERLIQVAQQRTESEAGQKEAERNQRIRVAALDSEAIQGENQSAASVAESQMQLEVRKTEANRDLRTNKARLEAEAVQGENEARAKIADSRAELEVKAANAHKLGKVAQAEANALVFEAQKLEVTAKLRAEELAREDVEKQKIEVQAEAEAEKTRRIAQGQADAVRAKYEAEAVGIQKVLEAKAEGYKKLVESAGQDAGKAATLLYLEQAKDITAEMAKVVSGIKIDKITVWDQGKGGSTADFLKNFVGAVSPLQGLASQAGLELPKFLGSLKGESEALDANPDPV